MTDDSFSRRAVEAALAEFRRYCNEELRRMPQQRDLVLTLEAVQELDDVRELQLREDAGRIAAQYTPLRVEVSVPKPVARADVPDGFRAWVLPRAGALDGSADGRSAHPGAVGHRDRRLLTLRQGSTRLPYLLTPGDWLPLRRLDGGRYDNSSEITVPAALKAVSRSVLVELRLDEDGELALRRTSAETWVTVAVNTAVIPRSGQSLPAERPLPDSGTISFDDGNNRTDLGYALTPWPEIELEPGTGRVDERDPTAYRTVLDVGGRLSWLHVEPTDVGEAPVPKRFAVPTPRFATGRTFVTAEVLYTRGTTPPQVADGRNAAGAGPERRMWHVKLFRTAAPQQAEFLRDHFATQAAAINRALSATGARPDRPPWGIAPVHVPDPGELGVEGERPQRTEFGARPLAAEPPDGRYGEWFGAPGGALSDCFVLVAAPFMPVATLPLWCERPDEITLPRFVRMAAALDACHAEGIAHCDIKPANTCIEGSDYVLVDSDSVTELKSRPDRLALTPPFARSELLRRNRVPGALSPLTETDIRDHDRFGFGMLVLAGLAGKGWVESVLSGEPGARVADSPEDVHRSLHSLWGGGRHHDELVAVALEPFDPAHTRPDAWTCSSWLARLTQAVVSTPADDGTLDEPPIYRGAFDREVAAVRDTVNRKSLGMPEKLLEVHLQIEHQRKRLRDQAALRYAAGIGVVGVLVFVVFLVQTISNLTAA